MPLIPKIGLLFFTSGWFRDVGLQSEGSDTSAAVEKMAERIIKRLEADIELVHSGVLYSTSEAAKAGRMIRDADVDGVLLVPLTWCEDQIVRAAFVELPSVSLLLWTFSPWESLPDFVTFQTALQDTGMVCTLQLSGMLRRENRW